jgi:hypothetical protein
MTTQRVVVPHSSPSVVCLSGRGQGKESVMIRSGRILLLLAALGGAAATTARAQSPDLPAPRERDVPSPSAFTVQPPPAAALPPTPPGPPTPTFAPANLPGPYFEVDPLLDRSPLPPPGWFADVDLGAVIPHVKNHLSGLVPRPGTTITDTVALPSAGLDWTVLPRAEAGYRLPSGFGAFSLSFRFLDTDGNGTAAGLDGPAALHSRLSLHEAGLDYSNNETSLWPNWDMKWTVGLRLLYVFFDSQADESPVAAAAGSTIFEQRESNWYCGFGPHVGLELDRRIGCAGLSLVLRGEGSLYLGRLRQAFAETSTTGRNGDSSIPVSQAVPAAAFFAGFRWQPPQWPGTEFFLGYQYEHWWDVGKNNNTTSTGELNEQGLFVRAVLNF